VSVTDVTLDNMTAVPDNENDKYIAELTETAEILRAAVAEGESPEMLGPIEALDEVIESVHKSWSGSNLGYHARTYYANYQPPPSDDLFNKEWGLMTFGGGRQRGWVVHDDEDEVKAYILERAGITDLKSLTEKSDGARKLLLDSRETVTSILANCLQAQPDEYLSGLKDKVADLSAPSAMAFARQFVPSGQIMSRDATAINAGLKVSPHHQLFGDRQAIEAPYVCLRSLADHAENAAKHLRRRPIGPPMSATSQIGSRVFIGHGGSSQWRELKDYVQDLGVPVDEFNRVPTAGYSTIARLGEMLDSAAMAFLVMTAEDETPDGGFRARQNVIHEVGLFQGRLDFDKAIVMVEEGCDDFSNIHGLTQVRYPRGNISAKFHEVRAVLEREELL
jgi:predicted nucleotide-binding protein